MRLVGVAGRLTVLVAEEWPDHRQPGAADLPPASCVGRQLRGAPCSHVPAASPDAGADRNGQNDGPYGRTGERVLGGGGKPPEQVGVLALADRVIDRVQLFEIEIERFDRLAG